MGQQHHHRKKKFSGATTTRPFETKSFCERSSVVSLLKSHQIKTKLAPGYQLCGNLKFREVLWILVSLKSLKFHPQNRRSLETGTGNYRPIVRRTAGPSQHREERGSCGKQGVNSAQVCVGWRRMGTGVPGATAKKEAHQLQTEPPRKEDKVTWGLNR